MIKREWLLGVGLISSGLGLGLGIPLAAADTDAIGAVAAVKPEAFGTAPSATEQTLVVGAGLVANEKIRTSTEGTANIIFADRSTLTVGKNSEVTLDSFVYDAASKTGGLSINLAQGALRFVGGQLSKTGDVTVKTPTATMTIRGGIGMWYQPGGGKDGYALFFYGKELKDLGSGQSIYQPGYCFRLPADGGPPEIVKITDELLAEILKNFNTGAGLAGSIPDEQMEAFKRELDDPELQRLIADLQDQIDDLSQQDRVILDALQRSQVPVTIPDSVGPYGS